MSVAPWVVVIRVVEWCANLLVWVFSASSGPRWLLLIVVHWHELVSTLDVGRKVFLLLPFETSRHFWLGTGIVVFIHVGLSLLVLNKLVLLVVWSSVGERLHFIIWSFHFVISFHSSRSVWLLLVVITDVIIYLTADWLDYSVFIHLFWLFKLLRLVALVGPWHLVFASWDLDVWYISTWSNDWVIWHSRFVSLPSSLESLPGSHYLHRSVVIDVSWWKNGILLIILVVIPEACRWPWLSLVHLLVGVEVAESSWSFKLVLILKVHFSYWYARVLLILIDSRVEAAGILVIVHLRIFSWMQHWSSAHSVD